MDRVDFGKPSRVVMLVDVDAFFAQVEQVLHPELRGKPVIVGGMPGESSVVASASYEARAFGVRTAMPLSRAYRLCPQAVFLKGRFSHYRRASDEILEVLEEFAPLVEPVSLDEAYLEFPGCERLYRLRRPWLTDGSTSDEGASRERNHAGPAKGDGVTPIDLAERIKRAIKARTQLDVSVGVGANKLMAKLACKLAKPNGVTWIRPGYEAEFLAPLVVSALPGIGRATRRRLEKFNVRTVGELRKIPPDLLETTFGTPGRTLAQYARGQDPSPLAPPKRPKSVSRETTFETGVMDRAVVEGMLYYITERACRRLRQLGLKARCVTVKLRYSDFETCLLTRSLPEATDQDHRIYELARELFRRLFTRRVRVRLIGVSLSSLSAEAVHQHPLFEADGHEKRGRLYRSLDRIRERFGFSAVTAGKSVNLLGKLEQDEEGFRRNRLDTTYPPATFGIGRRTDTYFARVGSKKYCLTSVLKKDVVLPFHSSIRRTRNERQKTGS